MGAHQGLVRQHPAAARPPTAASFGYRRHSDLFVLFVDRPAIYENNHITTSYEGALRRADTLSPTPPSPTASKPTATLSTQTPSANTPATRAQATPTSASAPYAASPFLGARDEILSATGNGNDNVFSPSIAAAYTLTHTTRLRASAGHGFRLPTYVDPLLRRPPTIGNPQPQPESSWSYEAGLEWTPANTRPSP